MRSIFSKFGPLALEVSNILGKQYPESRAYLGNKISLVESIKQPSPLKQTKWGNDTYSARLGVIDGRNLRKYFLDECKCHVARLSTKIRSRREVVQDRHLNSAMDPQKLQRA